MLFWIIAGAVAVVLLLRIAARKPRLRFGGDNPGDYEAELVRLCRGDRGEARRLIREERKRSPELSRAGAALAVVTRIRHERDPYSPPL